MLHGITGFRRGGAAAPSVLAVLALAGVLVASRPAAPTHARQGPSGGEMEVALLQCGISPEFLLAAGWEAHDVGTVADRGVAYLSQNWDLFRAALDRLTQATAAYEKLDRTVRQGIGKGEDVTALEAAEVELGAAREAFALQREGLEGAVLAGAAQDRLLVLDRVRQALDRSTPLQYAVIERSDPDWVRLRDALANVRISSRLEEDPDPDCALLVQETSADPVVTAAKVRLEALEAASQLWQRRFQE